MEVAILIATYNGEKYIKELLESLRKQSFQEFKCYIHDDGSSDNTLMICNEYAKVDPKHFKILVYSSCGNAKLNFLSLVQQISEEYMMFCDQDDIWRSNKIEKSLNEIKKIENGNHKVPALVFSDLKLVDCKLNIIAESYFEFTHKDPERIDFKHSLVKGVVPGCTFILNRSLYKLLNSYSNVNNISMHDWWSVIVSYAYGGKVGFIKQPLILYRQHESNTVGVKRDSFMKLILRNVKELCAGEIITNKKNWIEAARKQSLELSKMPGIKPEVKTFAEEFASIDSKSKLLRVMFYKKNFGNTYQLWRMLLWV